MRLWQLDLTEFDIDQAVLLQIAGHFLDTGHIPSTDGLSFTVGFRHPPLLALLLALPLLASRNPVWVSGFFALLDSLAAVLVFLTGRRLGGLRLGLAAGLLYAALPAAVLTGRKIWNPDLVPFFAALALWALVELRMRHNGWFAGGALLAIGLASQLHPANLVFLLPWLAIVVAERRRIHWPHLALPAIALGAVLAPYALLQAHSGGADLHAAARFLGLPPVTDGSALAMATTLLAGSFRQQGSDNPDLLAALAGVGPGGWIFLAVLLGGTVLGCRRKGAGLLVASWLALPILASIRHGAPVFSHYLLGTLPAAALLAGVSFAAIPPAPVALLLVLAFVGWRGGQWLSFQGTLAANVSVAHFGTALRYELQAAQAVARLKPGPALYVAEARDNHAIVFPYADGGKFAIKRFDGAHTFVFPRTDALYLVEGELRSYQFLTHEIGPPASEIRTSGGQLAYSLFDVPASLAQRFDASAGLQTLAANLAGSVALNGYASGTIAAQQPSPATLEWQVIKPLPAPQPDLRQFLHLVDSSGTTWSTDPDVYGFPPSSWTAGDRVVSWFDLAPRAGMPLGGYWLETGFYDAATGQRLAAGGASSAGSAVRIGPIRVAGAQPSVTTSQPLAILGPLELLAAHLSGAQVSLTWRARARPAANYTVFVHLLDASGRIVGQNDSPPQNGAYPTTLWAAGDVVLDNHQLQGATAGEQQLEIGLYTTPDLQRVPASLPDGQPNGDHVTLPAAKA